MSFLCIALLLRGLSSFSRTRPRKTLVLRQRTSRRLRRVSRSLLRSLREVFLLSLEICAEAFASSLSASFAALTEVSTVRLPLCAVLMMCTRGATVSSKSVCSLASVPSASFVSLDMLPFMTRSSFGHLVASTFEMPMGFFRLCLAMFVNGFLKQDQRKVIVSSEINSQNSQPPHQATELVVVYLVVGLMGDLPNRDQWRGLQLVVPRRWSRH